MFSPLIPEEVVRGNHAALQERIEKAEKHINQSNGGLPELSAAATFAAEYHSGIYASHELEALFSRITPEFPPVKRSHNYSTPRVLLVMTQDRGLRGPSMTVHRLPRLTGPSVEHTIVMTNQRVPAPIVPGTTQVVLTGTPMERIRKLQLIASQHDAVIAAVNPADIVAAIALANRPTDAPGVGFLNLAAQTHWVGSGAADFVINHDEASTTIAANRRGFRRHALTELSIPVPHASQPAKTRQVMRAQLGIDEKSVVLFTSGPSAKFRPIEPGLGFLDLVTPVVARNKNTVLIAVGPGDDHAWSQAAKTTDGRIRSLPLGTHVHDVRRAADVYVDPFPFSSSTAAIEAGMEGLPVVACSRYGDDRSRILISGVITFAYQSPEPWKFQDQLQYFIQEPSYRRSCGEATKIHLQSVHWGPRLEAQYRYLIDLLASGPASTPIADPMAPRFDVTDCLIAAFQHNRLVTRPEYSRDMALASATSCHDSIGTI